MAKTSLGLGIVQLLRRYKRELPVDFVARSCGASSGEARRYIERLEAAEVVVLMGESVRLA